MRGKIVYASACALVTVAGFTLGACASTAEAARSWPDGHSSEQVADNHYYRTFVDHHLIDGRNIPCVVVQSGTGQGISCDWEAK